ncbi:Putative Multi-sensor hybrid histidine kinase [Nitrospina watsonii]|uniref:histidine kinase n=2 Tax=Nitrospina watsonii TaxID=1323948 RepID=A0ABM9HAD6_9BACT|nr:Putative Multi-sensor hybrid histidine kinase [Nitrospina watsonii]
MGLVALSYLIAVFAAFTALDVMSRIRKGNAPPRHFLIVSSAVCMGGGIWAMHFIGMLAFRLPMPVSYDFLLTLFSLFVAIISSGAAFYFCGSLRYHPTRMIWGGLLMGSGITCMHYSGMLAMTMEATQHYDLGMAGLSVLIAVVASMAALYIMMKSRQEDRYNSFLVKMLAAIIMGAAVVGMHYTGMAAGIFVPSQEIAHQQEVLLDKDTLALAVVLMTFFILTIALLLEEYSSITLLPVLFSFFMIGIGWGGFQLVQKEVKGNIANLLRTHLQINVEAIDAVVKKELQIIKFWSGDERVRPNILSLAQKATKQDMTREELMATPELARLRKILGPFHRNQDHIGFVVVDTTGRTLAALLEEPVGQSLLKGKPFVEKALAGNVVFSSPFWAEVKLPGLKGIYDKNQPTIFAAAPVRHADGGVAAVLAFRLRPSIAFGKTLETTHSGETGEAYAFNRQGIMIGHSRFDHQIKKFGLAELNKNLGTYILEVRDPGGSVLEGYKPTLPRKQQPLTRMAASAVMGESGLDVNGYRDYRGVAVVGAWTWLPQYGIGVTAEMDFDEAFRSSRTLERIFVSLLFVLFFAVVITLIVKRRHTDAELREKQSQTNEIKARDEAEKFRQLFLAESDAILIFDVETRKVLDANPSAENMYGYPRQALLGLELEMLSGDPAATLQVFGEVVAGESVGMVVCHHKRKDGREFPVEVSAGLIQTSEGKVAFAVIRNITRRVKAEEDLKSSEERFALVMDASQDGLWDADMVTGRRYFSARWMAMLGYGPFELPHVQSTFFDLLHPEDMEAYRERIHRHLEEEDSHFEFTLRLRHKDGSYRWILTRGKTVQRDERGRALRAVGTHTDITERKLAEQKLVEAERNASLASEAKSRFVANMSHEIRTPMNAILGLTHLTLRTDLDDRQREFVIKIQKSTDSLLGIINDILDFSKIEAGKLDLEKVPFNLEEVLETVSQQEFYRAQKKGTELIFFNSPLVPAKLIGDPLRMGQVLTNLVNNAIKFTEKGTVAVYTDLVSANPEEDRVHLKFVVRDTGIGMSPEQLQRLFKAFSQADPSTTRRYGGTGLGLAITQQLVELMDGTIDVKSSEGKGTTFTLVLPFECGEKGVGTLPATTAYMEKRALIVTSSSDEIGMAKEMLMTVSCQVDCVPSLEEAEKKLGETGLKAYDLILLDINENSENWQEACRRIKNQSANEKAPKIVVAAPEENLVQYSSMKNQCVDGFLNKPIQLSQLFNMIMDLVYEKQKTSVAGLTQKPVNAFHSAFFAGKKVLVAEDNEINQQVARELLQEVGFEVRMANNGQEALSALKEERFDLVLLDLQMPVMDGLEAARHIREMVQFKNLPLIAITANAMVGDREKTRNAGMNDHITKPIDPEAMYRTLHRWLGDCRSRAPMPETGATSPEPKPIPGGDWTIEGIDVDQAIRRIGGKKETYVKILTGFYEQHLGQAGRIAAALEAGDFQTAQSEAHSLAGVAGNIGANDLFHSAKELETVLEKNKAQQRDGAFRDFMRNFDCIMEAVGQWLQSRGIPTHPVVKAAPVRVENLEGDSQLIMLLNNIAQLLSENDRRALNRSLTLRGYLENSPLHQEWVQLKQALEQYEFADAGKILQAIQIKVQEKTIL